MNKLRTVFFFALPWAVSAADPSLLQLLMPDAKVVAGLQVTQAKNSLFGQYVLSHMQIDNTGFQNFTAQTGFDPRIDVSEIVMASNSSADGAQRSWLIAAKGTFDVAKITAAAQANGGAVNTYQGVKLVTYTEPSNPQIQNAIAFLDSSTAATGDLASVQAAIGRQKSSAPTGGPFAQVQQVSSQYAFWFVSTVPLSQFSAVLPNGNSNSAMNNNILAGISQASGGISFGDTVTVATQAVARSDKDAQALVDVVKFFASFLQMNRQQNSQAGQVSAVLDNLQASASGNVATISLGIPEQQLEQMLDTAKETHQASRKPALRIN